MLGNRPLLPARWALAPESRVEFTLRHLGVATIHGAFGPPTGAVRADAGNALRELRLLVDAASVDTGNPVRDARLRELGVFGSELHPRLTFHSDWSYEKGREREGLQGTLTMHGQAHVLELIAAPGTVAARGDGRLVYSTVATGVIDRRNWGVAVHPLLEIGGVLLGHEVHLRLQLRALVGDE